MNLVYLILFHKEPEQLFRLVRSLSGQGVFFVIHVCKNSDCFTEVEAWAEGREDLFFCERVRATWGAYLLMRAEYNAVETALAKVPSFSHAVLLSAQDYPIKSGEQVRDFFTQHIDKGFLSYVSCSPQLNDDGVYFHPIKGRWTDHDERGRYQFYNFKVFRNFYLRINGEMNRSGSVKARGVNQMKKWVFRFFPKRKFFDGSNWFALTQAQCQYVVETHRPDGVYHQFMRHVYCPDEMFFQTALLNSPHRDSIVSDNLHYIFWPEHLNHPKLLECEDFEALKASGASKLYARKFDQNVDSAIFDRIDQQLLNQPEAS